MLKIILVDDHEVVRLGLKSLLSRYPQFQVVAEADSAQTALEKTEELRPDVVVMDVRLPGRSGIDATREITDRYPDTKVIILTSYAEDEILFEAITAGASGYVLKQIGSGELIRALETIGKGESLLDPAVTKKVFDRVREASRLAKNQVFASLTNQEIRVLALLSEGKTNKEIANDVFLSEKTVRNYVSSILSKLDLSTRAEAAAFAVKNDIKDHLPNE